MFVAVRQESLFLVILSSFSVLTSPFPPLFSNFSRFHFPVSSQFCLLSSALFSSHSSIISPVACCLSLLLCLSFCLLFSPLISSFTLVFSHLILFCLLSSLFSPSFSLLLSCVKCHVLSSHSLFSPLSSLFSPCPW